MAAAGSERKLELTTPSETELVMTRVFDAPAHLVFAAWTRPELVRQWWACMEGFEMSRCDIDLRVGGRWAFGIRGHGQEHVLHGEYRELAAPGRIVTTWQYNDTPGPPAIVTMTFVEKGGQTVFTSHGSYPSKDVRDAVLATGVEHGTNIALARLEEILREQVAA